MVSCRRVYRPWDDLLSDAEANSPDLQYASRGFWFTTPIRATITAMQDQPSMPHQVVILLGTNYCGSHLLSHLLSAHSRCLGVGEIHRYQQLIEQGSTAPVVSEYNASPLFNGLDGLPVQTWHQTLATRYAQSSGVDHPVIIDNSKKVRWVKRLADAQDLEIRLVHLIRDPRALVLRWLNTYDSDKRRRRQRMRVAKRVPTRAPQILAGDWTTVFIYKWLRENRQIQRFIEKQGYPHAVVTYHDMVFDTPDMLSALMPKLGLEYEPGQLQFGQGNTLGTTKTAHAEAVKQSEIRPDLKWHTQLHPGAAASVTANRDVQDFLTQLSLRCGDKGLVPL